MLFLREECQQGAGAGADADGGPEIDVRDERATGRRPGEPGNKETVTVTVCSGTFMQGCGSDMRVLAEETWWSWPCWTCWDMLGHAGHTGTYWDMLP